MNSQHIPTEEEILLMDGKELWFAKVVQPKPQRHIFWDCVNPHCYKCGATYPNSDPCPPPITEPLEVIACNLVKEMWPGITLYELYEKTVKYLDTKNGSSVLFDALPIIKTVLLAEKGK